MRRGHEAARANARSYSTIAAITTMPLSLEKTATAAAIAMAAIHAARRAPELRNAKWQASVAASTPHAASRSARPTMFVTDSVSTGWTAQIAAISSAAEI